MELNDEQSATVCFELIFTRRLFVSPVNHFKAKYILWRASLLVSHHGRSVLILHENIGPRPNILIEIDIGFICFDRYKPILIDTGPHQFRLRNQFSKLAGH